MLARRVALRQMVSGFRLAAAGVLDRRHQASAGTGHQWGPFSLGDRLGHLDRAALHAAGDQRGQHLQHDDLARRSPHG
jgi:hypothetical protein